MFERKFLYELNPKLVETILGIFDLDWAWKREKRNKQYEQSDGTRNSRFPIKKLRNEIFEYFKENYEIAVGKNCCVGRRENLCYILNRYNEEICRRKRFKSSSRIFTNINSLKKIFLKIFNLKIQQWKNKENAVMTLSRDDITFLKKNFTFQIMEQDDRLIDQFEENEFYIKERVSVKIIPHSVAKNDFCNILSSSKIVNLEEAIEIYKVIIDNGGQEIFYN